MSRAKTKQEILDEFMSNLAGIANHWACEAPDRNMLERCNGLVFSLLVIFDGGHVGLPAMKIAIDPHEDDKNYRRSIGANWYEPGMVFNDDVEMHEIWHRYARKS